MAGSTYLGQVGTLTGWTKSTRASTESEDQEDQQSEQSTCRPRKLGLPILGRRECLKSGIQPDMFHESSGCVGVIGVGDIICQVSFRNSLSRKFFINKIFIHKNDAGTSVMHRSYSGYYDLVGE